MLVRDVPGDGVGCIAKGYAHDVGLCQAVAGTGGSRDTKTFGKKQFFSAGTGSADY